MKISTKNKHELFQTYDNDSTIPKDLLSIEIFGVMMLLACVCAICFGIIGFGVGYIARKQVTSNDEDKERSETEQI